MRIIFLMLFSPFFRKVRGFENLPKENGFIVASNHASLIDGILLTTYLTGPLNRHVHYLTSAKFYTNPFYRFLFKTAEDIKIEGGEKSKSTFIAMQYLKKGEIVGIFPEGPRSLDGKIRKGRPGVAHLALSAKVPVVPVGLVNIHKLILGDNIIPRPARCEINVGAPLEFKQFHKDYDEAMDSNDSDRIKKIEEEVARKIMQEIARLSNQEYPY